MKRTQIPAKVASAVFTSALLVLGLFCLQNAETRADPPRSKYPYLPMMTEISPFAVEGESPWIEFHNPLEKPVNVSELKIVINDSFEYSFPKGLPPVPQNGFIILVLDGKGEEEEPYRYEGRTAVLHSPWDLTKVMKGKPGQIAVYRKVSGKTIELVGFVSWGAPGSKKSLTPKRNRIWKSNWFVELAQGSGDYDPAGLKEADYSIGLYHGSKTTSLTDWAIYFGDEASPGRENVVPRPSLFIPPVGAMLRCGEIAVAWITNKYARAHRFQIAKDSEFGKIIEDKILKTPVYRQERVLPEGTYYYRVKTIDKAGRESAWSRIMKIISEKMLPNPGYECDDRVEENVLPGIDFKNMRKDTKLLCLDGCASDSWDNAHGSTELNDDEHGSKNCVRASISMMVSYYGKSLSQDRIAYYTEEEGPAMMDGPEGDLAHGESMTSTQAETEALEWALNAPVTLVQGSLSFSQLKSWLDNGHPVMFRSALGGPFGHVRVIDGYGISSNNKECVHVLDPGLDARWTTLDPFITAAWVGPVSAPNAREDEASIWKDSDNDGIMDFDEQKRFFTGRFDKDSDNDDVPDKNDIREYVFDAAEIYSKRDADFEADGRRKEKDPDNDGDTYRDGCEDKNFNGKYDTGETSNFNVDTGLACASKPTHAIIIFDRSGSMVHPPSDPVKKYEEAANAAVLFLDTWLVNNPPADTKVGLVFYDNTAYFDTSVTTDTTLETLSQGKRDKINVAFSSNLPDYGSTSIGAGLLKAMDTKGFNIASVPVTGQNRVVIVLTDGKENTNPRMDDAAVIQKRVDGQVDGYVLGIGDPVQIDAIKLDSLADILSHHPASLAKGLNNSELQKFFLQVLAETQELEFSVDPAGEIEPGQTKSHEVAVSEGTEIVTFIVVWHAPDVTLNFTLTDPLGRVVQADVKRTNTLYQLSAKNSPVSGSWTIAISAGQTGATAGPENIPYNLMVLEKNTRIQSHFDARAGFFDTGQPILLTATLSDDRRPVTNARVMVEIKKPTIGFGDFVANIDMREAEAFRSAEEDIRPTPLELKYMFMTEKRLRIPETKTLLELNDTGMNGDHIPGDGKYSAYFKDTRIDGIYTFKFRINATLGQERERITREETRSVLVTPRVDPRTSKISILRRSFNESDNTTYVKFCVLPTDRYGNRIGPGHDGIVKAGVRLGKVTKILDKLDGTYEVEMMIEGNVMMKLNLLPLFSRPKS